MEINFTRNEKAPERLLAEAEIVFDADSPLSNMKLVGISIWRGVDGEPYATFPSRQFGTGEQKKYYDFLRAVDAKNYKETLYKVKSWIMSEYDSWASSDSDDDSDDQVFL